MDIKVDAQRGFVRIVLVGEQSLEEIKQAFSSLLEHPDYRPGMNRLWDIREASVSSLTADQLRDIERHARALEPTPEHLRVAVLVSRDVDFGVIRMLESLANEKAPVTVDSCVCRDLAEAEEWVSSTEST